MTKGEQGGRGGRGGKTPESWANILFECPAKGRLPLKILKCRTCGKVPCVGKEKMRFRATFNTYKSVHRSYRKKTYTISAAFLWTWVT